MDYIYSVARVRAKEASLLKKSDLERLIAAEDFDEALKFLSDKGYDASGGIDETIAENARETNEFLAEIADDKIMDIIRLPIDYHNVKAAVKAVFSDVSADGLMLSGGSVGADTIYESVKKREYGALGEELSDAAIGAMSLLRKTQDGQLCDIQLDNALLCSMEKKANETEDEQIIKYAKTRADLANLKAALRCARLKKGRAFVENALYDGGTLNISRLSEAAQSGENAVCEFVRGSAYSDLEESMKKSVSEFEKECDNVLTAIFAESKYESFSASPILAYAHAKKTEQNALRLILSAKKNQIPNEIIRERVRELYV
jgi:V/A-type H+-transporting ATPase subunit C